VDRIWAEYPAPRVSVNLVHVDISNNSDHISLSQDYSLSLNQRPAFHRLAPPFYRSPDHQVYSV
jgi:hypothetical protein